MATALAPAQATEQHATAAIVLAAGHGTLF